MKSQLSSKKILRNSVLGFSGVLGVNIIFIVFPVFWANLLLGKESLSFFLTFQDIMWFIFFIGMAQIWERRQNFIIQNKHWEQHYLPEDFEAIIDDEVLTFLYGLKVYTYFCSR